MRRQYIGLIHKEPTSDYGVSFPDFPGVITAGTTLDEARALAEEALSFHVEGLAEDGDAIPEPSSLEAVMADPKPRRRGDPRRHRDRGAPPRQGQRYPSRRHPGADRPLRPIAPPDPLRLSGAGRAIRDRAAIRGRIDVRRRRALPPRGFSARKALPANWTQHARGLGPEQVRQVPARPHASDAG